MYQCIHNGKVYYIYTYIYIRLLKRFPNMKHKNDMMTSPKQGRGKEFFKGGGVVQIFLKGSFCTGLSPNTL